ncbi:MAG: ADP-ribosyltransferase, partial [Victivallis vadensis]
LSISGATKGLPTVEQATAAGLCHPNCTHSFVAVGEFARSEDFTGDGRPKTGVNSPGKEEKNDPEAWKKYRQGPAKPAAASKKKSATTAPETQKPGTTATAKPGKSISTAVQPELPLDGPGIKQNQPLTDSELSEVREYTRSEGYQELNDYLRKGKSGDSGLDRKAEHLDRAIRKSTTDETLTLWRGVVDDFNSLKARENGLILEIPVAGFQSTSRSFDVACGFAGNDGRSAVVYKITVPKGKHALDVSSISHKPDEREVLLPSTGKYRVDKVYYEKDDDGFIIRQIVEVTYE